MQYYTTVLKDKQYYSNEKRYTTVSHSVDKFQKHNIKGKKIAQKGHIVWFHFYEA